MGTRGKLYLICEKLVIESVEFKSAMKPNMFGHDAIKLLEKVECARDFKDGIESFNELFHNYEFLSLVTPVSRQRYMKSEGHIIMTKRNYFKLYFVDWTFWKNISKQTVMIRTKDYKEIEVKPMEQVALYFGFSDGHYRNLTECRRQIDKGGSELEKLHARKVEQLVQKLKVVEQEYFAKINEQTNNEIH